MPESAPHWTNDHAAVDRRRRTVAAVFRAPAEIGGATLVERSVDGHVARSRGRHRRGSHGCASGHGPFRPSAKNVTVGYFAPLPPARTGVADYAQGLLQGLQRKGRVLVGDPDTDVCLYQLGNNQLHGPIFDQAMRRPGVVLLHDAVLHHFFLGRLSEDEYVREFARNYGEWTCGLARDLWAARARSGVDPRYFEYPMLRSVVETAKAVIVHNPGAAAIALRHGARRVIEIPHWFQLPFPVATRARASNGKFTIGVFGHLRETKRLQTVFRAFSRARRAAGMTLLVAGEFASRDLERACAAEWTQPGIVRKGYLADREFWSHAASVDACVNLRYPAAGETSGIAIRLMGLGKPVVLSRG